MCRILYNKFRKLALYTKKEFCIIYSDDERTTKIGRSGIERSFLGMSYIDTIKEKARADRKTIVLPETNDKRTLIAACLLYTSDAADE